MFRYGRTNTRGRVAGVLCAAGVVSAIGAAPAMAAPGDGYAVDKYGYVQTFKVANPSQTSFKTISGIPAGSEIVGIDERPKTGALYAVTKNAAGQASAYVLDPATGAATLAFALKSVTTGNSVVLTGTKVGVDFNPSADALRITGDDGQNLRALPSDRVVATVSRFAGDTFTDGTLSYLPIGSMPRPAATGITASAYTNNVALTGGPTTLLNIDSANEDLTVQVPPNDGTQAKVADLALNGRAVQGFDISTANGDKAYLTVGSFGQRPAHNGIERALTGLGLIPARTGPFSLFATVDTTTGAITPVGQFRSDGVIDFAVDTPAP